MVDFSQQSITINLVSDSSSIVKNTASQLGSKVITSLIGLVTRKLLTNYLGPAGFGDYAWPRANDRGGKNVLLTID